MPLANLAVSRKGVILEDKGRALAIHYRKAPDEAEGIRHPVEDLVHIFRPGPYLRVIHGKMVSDVKPLHADTRALCAGPRVIDDLTAEEEEELLKYLAFLRSRSPS